MNEPTPPVTVTGYDGAHAVPVGATIERVYFCTPGTYAPARYAEHDTLRDALCAAIENTRAYFEANPETLGPDTVTIDCRWVIRMPGALGRPAGSMDTVASRTRFSCVREAEAYLERLDRFNAVVS